MKITENLVEIKFEDIQIGDTFYLDKNDIFGSKPTVCCIKNGRDKYLISESGAESNVGERQLFYVPVSQFIESQQRKFIPQNNDINLQYAIPVVTSDNPKKQGSVKVICPDCGFENYYTFFQYNGLCECEHCKRLFTYIKGDEKIITLPYQSLCEMDNYKEFIKNLREKESQNADKESNALQS